ncbi:hypothetical protein [Pseudozobellia sp. WGM2]|uniref:hypothetical protein n=1 Tax=Pseudozobellia sp. WGM2 TaxID=2787625 RepID=UPI001ADFDAFC|nr:hypothetical protein [Pseudozobellia sp. WGM2]
MKKILFSLSILGTVVAFSSCSIDDSNDIEIIKPGDTVITGKTQVSKISLVK